MDKSRSTGVEGSEGQPPSTPPTPEMPTENVLVFGKEGDIKIWLPKEEKERKEFWQNVKRTVDTYLGVENEEDKR